MLSTRRLAIIVTLKCTLKCKLCCNCVPMYNNPPIIEKELIFNDIKEAFTIYDRIEWFQFVGGELFLHPNMDDIIKEGIKYSNQFSKLIIMTNGTIIPSKGVFSVLSENKEKVQVQISDYGVLSYKIRDLERLLKDHQIPYVTKVFHGDIQHYGGWVDCGGFDDRGYSDEEIQYLFDHCWQIGMSNLHLYNGEIHNCIRSLFAKDLNQLEIPKDEYIDLRNDEYTLEEKRILAAKFNTSPLTACKACGGFDTKNSKRYPAAEQL